MRRSLLLATAAALFAAAGISHSSAQTMPMIPTIVDPLVKGVTGLAMSPEVNANTAQIQAIDRLTWQIKEAQKLPDAQRDMTIRPLLGQLFDLVDSIANENIQRLLDAEARESTTANTSEMARARFQRHQAIQLIQQTRDESASVRRRLGI